MESNVNGFGLVSAGYLPPGGHRLAFPTLPFDAIKMADLAQEPVDDAGVLLPRFVKLSSRVRPTGRELDVLLASGKAGIRGVTIALQRAGDANDNKNDFDDTDCDFNQNDYDFNLDGS